MPVKNETSAAKEARYEAEAEALRGELTVYFSRAGRDKTQNLLLAQPIVEKWGGIAVGGGLGWIVGDIKRMSEQTIKLALTTPGQALNRVVIGRLMTDMAYMHDLVEAGGENAHRYLVDSVMQHDEDVRALAAYFLADNAFSSPKSVERLENAYSFTEGTSCQMAIALALFMSGERKHLKSFIDKEYFGSKDRYINLLGIARQVAPNDSIEDLEQHAVLTMVVPEVFGADPLKAGLMKILALDIESDGAFVRNTIPNWKRKHYK